MPETLEKDFIIIGGGINGLSAGLAYALNNDLTKKKVLIIEKNPVSGGYKKNLKNRGEQKCSPFLRLFCEFLPCIIIKNESYNH